MTWFVWVSNLCMQFRFSSSTTSGEVLHRTTLACPIGSILASTHPAKGSATLRFFLASKWLPSSTNLRIKVSEWLACTFSFTDSIILSHLGELFDCFKESLRFCHSCFCIGLLQNSRTDQRWLNRVSNPPPIFESVSN